MRKGYLHCLYLELTRVKLILEGTIWWRSRGEGINPVLPSYQKVHSAAGLQGRILRFRWRIDGFNPAN